jgi:hypothetical protein
MEVTTSLSFHTCVFDSLIYSVFSETCCLLGSVQGPGDAWVTKTDTVPALLVLSSYREREQTREQAGNRLRVLWETQGTKNEVMAG